LNIDAMLSSNSNEWGTPQNLFDELNKEFDFTLDPCSTVENHKCNKFYTKEDDGLDRSWKNEIVFVNPPYGREIGKWVEKCYKEFDGNGATCVMLIPARTDTSYFHNFIYHKAEIRFIRGRVKFVSFDKEKIVNASAPFPSMIVIFKKHYET